MGYGISKEKRLHCGKNSMNIFCDFHHAGMAQGIQRLFHDRLGHKVYFPNQKWCRDVSIEWPGPDGGLIWTLCSELGDTWAGCDLPELISSDRFFEIDWDIVLISRTESQSVIKHLLDLHQSSPKLIAVCGNEGGGFDYEWIPNLMSSALSTFIQAPASVYRLLYSQEFGRHIMDAPFEPITNDSLHTVNAFMHNHQHFRDPYAGPDGDGSTPFGLWLDVRGRLPAHKFRSFGNTCEHGLKFNVQMPEAYRSGSLTWHYKPAEGYGFSVLQSVASGRLVLVQRGFYDDRMAHKYLLPGETCFETDWSAKSIADIIWWYSSSLDRANEYAEKCYKIGKKMFNWALEADQVREWLKELK